jgi:hypothetical protein
MTKQIATPPSAPAPLGQAAFFTLKKSNEGQRMKIAGPDGKETKAWIDVRGQDSDAFQRANNASRRELIAYVQAHGEIKEGEVNQAYEDFGELQKRKLRAALVVGWSFPEEATEAAVMEFFRQAPNVALQVDVFASKRERFAGA